ncbi:desiccation protectant protein Lea14 homolog isoform X2 [Jatropha curcas]|uniref:desiccation protectant protein Lea14 homolog isoform X2 n=1 Tax=Jatropha curcas TaxID=180498 RepID=UPI0005FBA72D|nr:desiccation protectant protein Lea14 homolog isoform X2 [Jatropha curcas]
MELVDKAKNFLAEKVANVKKPEASVTDVDLGSIHRDRIEYKAKVSVTNPYSQPLPVCEVSYTLKSDGRVIVSGNMPDPGSLKASDTTVLTVPLNVPHSILVSLVKDVSRDWDIDYELELGLTFDLPIVGDITIPLSTKGEIKLPTLSDCFFGSSKEE